MGCAAILIELLSGDTESPGRQAADARHGLGDQLR